MLENEFDKDEIYNEEIKPEESSNTDVEVEKVTKETKSKSKKAQKEEPKEEIYIPEDNGIKIENTASEDGTVTIQPVKFASFDQMDQINGEENKNLDILMDVKLQLNVELGRCELPIKKVLELTRGSIIELDKVAGESVELFANGKLIAQGEVVVIDDNFGLRITNITEPDNRIN